MPMSHEKKISAHVMPRCKFDSRFLEADMLPASEKLFSLTFPHCTRSQPSRSYSFLPGDWWIASLLLHLVPLPLLHQSGRTLIILRGRLGRFSTSNLHHLPGQPGMTETRLSWRRYRTTQSSLSMVSGLKGMTYVKKLSELGYQP